MRPTLVHRCLKATLLGLSAAVGFGLIYGKAHGEKYACWYFAPGNLIPGTGRVAEGEEVERLRKLDWGEPGGLNPIRGARGTAKSQIHSPGGYYKPGDECAAKNFQGPDRDTFCEARSKNVIAIGCKPGGAHVGTDINGGTRDDCLLMRIAQERILKSGDDPAIVDLVPVQAVQDGVITYRGEFTLDLSSKGRVYRHTHLHMDTLKVKFGDKVKKGQILGYLYDDFKKAPGFWTTFHLHWEIKFVFGELEIYAPPYMAFIRSKERTLNAKCQLVQ